MARIVPNFIVPGPPDDLPSGTRVRTVLIEFLQISLARRIFPKMDTTGRYRLGLCVLLLIPLGIGTKFYAGPAAGWVRGSAGAVLYVTFWTMVVALVAPSQSPWAGASGVFIVTCGLEFLQLWSPPALQTVRRSFFGHLLLGSTFDRWDLFHYALGAVAGALLWGFVRTEAGAREK